MKRLLAAFAGALALSPLLAHSQLKAELTAPVNTYRWGTAVPLQLLVTNCPTSLPVFFSYSGSYIVDSISGPGPVAFGNFSVTPQPGCTPTAAPVPLSWDRLPAGWQYLQATVPLSSGPSGPVKSAAFPVRFDHEFDIIYRGDHVLATLATDPRWTACAVRTVNVLDRESAGIPMPPPNIRTTYEMFVIAAGGCTKSPVPGNDGLAIFEIPEKLGLVWYYRPATGWMPVGDPTQCGFLCPPGLYGAYLDRRVILPIASTGPSTYGVLAISYPQLDARATDLQDMWWAGPSEAGWGLTIAKRGERMFVAGFIYDQFGKATWVVMPSGTWDPITAVYYGDLYIPKSNPYTSYAGGALDMRTSVGKGSLSFVGPDDGHFDYTIGDYAGGKTISRYKFAATGKDAPAYAGIWWGGATQEGWGLSVAQQGETIFATWYTYGQDFEPVWFFMPAGQKTGAGKYSGTLYRTTGGPWPGFHYEGASTKVAAVGTMTLEFASDAKSGKMTAVVDGKTIANPILPFDF